MVPKQYGLPTLLGTIIMTIYYDLTPGCVSYQHNWFYLQPSSNQNHPGYLIKSKPHSVNDKENLLYKCSKVN